MTPTVPHPVPHAEPAATRIGVVVDSAAPSPMLARLLNLLRREPGVTLIALVVTPPRRPVPIGERAARLLVGAILGVEHLMIAALGRLLPSVASRLDLASLRPARFDRVLTVPSDPGAGGDAAQGIDQGSGQGSGPPLDLVLTQRAELPAGVLAIAGNADVIRFTVGSAAPGTPDLAGFAEVYAAADGTPVSVCRVGPRPGAERVLYQGSARTRPLFYLNQIAIWDRAASLLRSLLVQRRAGLRTAGTPPRVEAADPPAGASPLLQLLAYPVRATARLIRLAIRQGRGRRNWTVSIHRRCPETDGIGSLTPVEVAPVGCFHADPVLYRCPRTGVNYCFVEEFARRTGLAHIAVLEQGPSGWRRCGVALAEPFHLSFPFVFEHEGALYMCPESYLAGKIQLYRCVDFPLGWEPCRTLIDDISAADTMLFPRDGRWWMLTNVDRAGSPDHQSELHVYHAASPLSADWTPVAGNPVKVGPIGARNGGLVGTDGRLFRYGQIQTFDAYGHGLNKYEITRLDPDGYEERFVERILPPGESGSVGIHTYSAVGDLVAIDLLGAGAVRPPPAPRRPGSPDPAAPGPR